MSKKTFELEGKTYVLCEEHFPQSGAFLLPGSSDEHTIATVLVDETAQKILIKFGLAEEVSVEAIAQKQALSLAETIKQLTARLAEKVEARKSIEEEEKQLKKELEDAKKSLQKAEADKKAAEEAAAKEAADKKAAEEAAAKEAADKKAAEEAEKNKK